MVRSSVASYLPPSTGVACVEYSIIGGLPGSDGMR